MTTHIRVCNGCPLRHKQVSGRITSRRCDILQAKLDGIRGLGLRLIDFDCPTKLALFQPGQCVTFMGYVGEDLEEFTGYVMGWVGNKVRVISEESENPICRISPIRLSPGKQPNRRVCVHCGLPEGLSVEVKMRGDERPRAWVCREEYDDTYLDPERGRIVLPCEYAGGIR